MGSRDGFKNAEVWSKRQYLLLEKQISLEKIAKLFWQLLCCCMIHVLINTFLQFEGDLFKDI